MNNSTNSAEDGVNSKKIGGKLVGLFLGPALAALVILIGPPDSVDGVLTAAQTPMAAWIVLALLVWMAVWWVTEAIPVPVTAMLPLVILPLFGVQSMRATAAPFMHPVIVLLLGGFIIAKAIERWNLHSRIALNIIHKVGSRPSMILGGFMVAAAFLSMWISNSATSIMLLPIAISMVAAIDLSADHQQRLTWAVLLGIAYACSVGGLGTPVGTPTNLIILGYLSESAGLDIDFITWMKIGVPTVCILVPCIWVLLSRFIFRLNRIELPEDTAVIKNRLAELGKLKVPEKRVLTIFAIVAILWSFKNIFNDITIFGVQPLANLSDAITAIFGVFLCFLIPAGDKEIPGERILDWKTAEGIPWGPLILFGGGMSLAIAIQTSGLAAWAGQKMSFVSNLPLFAIIFVITMIVIFLTEVMSNVAAAATITPIFGAAALSYGISVEMIAFPIALAASCAFMLPTATGPNAVIFSSDKISLPRMAKSGLLVNFIAVIILTLISYFFVPIILG